MSHKPLPKAKTADTGRARYRVSELAPKKPTRFRLAPDAAARAALAGEIGIIGIAALSFEGEIRPSGRHDWELQGHLRARVVQPCVVTLAPVASDIAEPVVRRYLAEMPEPEGDEVEMPEDDTAEPLPEVIDLAAVMAEALVLALPLYPRAPGAAFDAIADEGPEETRKPFAGLAGLLKGGPSGGEE